MSSVYSGLSWFIIWPRWSSYDCGSTGVHRHEYKTGAWLHVARCFVEATWQTSPHRQEVAKHYSPREGGKGRDLGRLRCWFLGLIMVSCFLLLPCAGTIRFVQSERIHGIKIEFIIIFILLYKLYKLLQY